MYLDNKILKDSFYLLSALNTNTFVTHVRSPLLALVASSLRENQFKHVQTTVTMAVNSAKMANQGLP